MADNRAMEEQMERHNPVNPKNSLSNRREMVMRNVGAGATPSMGLSEFRGGRSKMMEMVEMVEAKRKPVNRVKGPGKASEARMMGHALGKHLYGLHGGSFHADFCSGMREGAGLCGGDFFEDEMAEAKRDDEFRARQKRNTDAGRHPNDNGDGYFGLMPDEAHKKKQEEINAQGARENPIAHAIGKYGMKAVNGLTDALVEHGTKFGAPQMLVDGIKKAREVGQKGFGKTGHTEGKGKKRRSPASAGDGRRKRAEIVKRVMAEKGMKMIEASKYVKQHGLY
jgi:hypothetical protein